MRRLRFHSLFWKISIVFLVILFLLSGVYIYITLFSAEMYFQETNQKLNRTVAAQIARDVPPIIDGKIDDKILDDILHNVMVLNPSMEVYLLDPEGSILAYTAPPERIKRKDVSVEPIRKFIAEEGKNFVMGDDPRGEDAEKVFSAAPVFTNGRLQGYVYIILGGEDYEHIAQLLFRSYILKLGVRALLISLIAASLLGLLALAFITKKFRTTVQAVDSFKRGKLDSRIPVNGNDEIDEVATAFNEMADTIESNIEEIKQSDALRRELIANVSHDLRTPLTSIQGYVETILMKNESLSAVEREEFLHIILDEIQSLRKLILELFELSKLEAKETVPHVEPFPITELAQDVALKFQPQAEKKQVRIRTLIPSDLPLVLADIGLIERILQNLIDNALRYTPTSGVVTIELAQNNGNVLVKIFDTGCGIPQEELSHIFDRSYRSRRTGKSSAEGAGLGLTIAKKILEAHGTEFHVTSQLNVGTTFSFKLPVSAH